jgi:hypothetical protein
VARGRGWPASGGGRRGGGASGRWRGGGEWSRPARYDSTAPASVRAALWSGRRNIPGMSCIMQSARLRSAKRSTAMAAYPSRANLLGCGRVRVTEHSGYHRTIHEPCELPAGSTGRAESSAGRLTALSVRTQVTAMNPITAGSHRIITMSDMTSPRIRDHAYHYGTSRIRWQPGRRGAGSRQRLMCSLHPTERWNGETGYTTSS